MTIKERRQIIFDAEELDAALREANSIAPQLKLPDRHIAVEFCPSEGCIFTKYDTEKVDSNASRFKLEGPLIAVLMIRWCNLKNIPVPKHGSKSVRVMDRSVILRIDYDGVSL
jgi:hypothetical protein